MKLSEYASKHGIQYRAAWNRFKAGKIPGAWQDESGTIVIPDKNTSRLNDAAVYARVSDPAKRKTQLPHQRYRVVESVAEVGSGVDDKRRKLTALLKRDDWGTLIVEHKDRLTRFGFEWFRLFIEQSGRRLVVINETKEERADLIADFVAIIYSFSARLYGQRRTKRVKEFSRMVSEDGDEIAER